MPITDIASAMREMRAGSKHVKTRAQAVAAGMKAQRAGRPIGGRKPRRSSGRNSGRR